MESYVEINGVSVRRVGGENDPNAKVVVAVRWNGQWHDIIEEPIDSAFSHSVYANKIKELTR